MNTKFFKPLFIALFLTTFSFGLKAQEDKSSIQWELAQVFQQGNLNVAVVQTNAPFEEFSVTNKKLPTEDFLKVVQKMVNDGWGIVDIQLITGGNICYLKRKLK